MGRSSGTGQPLFFRCSACRRKHGTNERRAKSLKRGPGYDVWLTGDVRWVGNGGSRSDVYARQYICNDCDHCGWSKHIDLKHRSHQ